MKRCCRCKNKLPRSDFGPCRTMRDGLNKRCRLCNRAAANQNNQCRAARKRGEVIAQPKPEPIVRAAIKTPRTPEEIAGVTGVDEDTIGDVLAEMWDSGRAKVLGRKWQLAA